MIEVEYRCEDGTPFAVRFRIEADVAASWRIEREHGRDPRTPLGDALERLGVEGGRRAYEEVGLLLPPGFDLGPEANGFAYYRDGPMPADFMTATVEGCAKLLDEHGSALAIWRDRCLPRTQQACRDLDAAGPEVPLDELAQLQAYGLQMTMIPAFVCGNDLSLLAAAISDLYGDEATLVAHELAQGYDTNVTLQADQRLWELGRVARDDAEVLSALRGDGVAAAMAQRRSAGRSEAFFAAVDSFLADYGRRAEGWDIACPTWDEQGEGFWAQVAQMAGDEVPAPADAIAAGAARRAALAAEISDRLAHDDAALGRFQRRLARIEPYVLVREERAQWQVTLAGRLRHAVLRRGAALVEAGLLDTADDVLFLVPEELGSPEDAGDLRTVVSARRAAHAAWCAATPPATIGGAALEAPPSPADGLLRGVAAARGVATGTARVIRDLEDADRLEPGDVLVCVMTSPPWTPLFGLASAVVADTGDIGSHPAIAAREYGIPCVLGIAAATRTIPDGSTVTVDGAAGTVRIGP